MLTTCQQIILHCLFIEPEDPKGFKKLQTRVWHAQNRERTAAYREKYWPAYYQKNAEALSRQASKWNSDNREARRRIVNRHRKKRYHSDLSYRMECVCRSRLVIGIRNGGGNKDLKTREMLGCTIPELRSHLEKQFRLGMTWKNYGSGWEIDHRRPCASFDLTDIAQQKECFHFSNLQPLWVTENREKYDSV